MLANFKSGININMVNEDVVGFEDAYKPITEVV